MGVRARGPSFSQLSGSPMVTGAWIAKCDRGTAVPHSSSSSSSSSSREVVLDKYVVTMAGRTSICFVARAREYAGGSKSARRKCKSSST